MERIVNIYPFRESILHGQCQTDAMLFEERYTLAFGTPLGEEIVRCRDCEFTDAFHEERFGTKWCTRFEHGTINSGFCAWGERRKPTIEDVSKGIEAAIDKLPNTLRLMGDM